MCECVNTLVGGLLYHEMQAQNYGKSDNLIKNNIGKSDIVRIFAVGKSDIIMLKRKIDSYLDNFFTRSKKALLLTRRGGCSVERCGVVIAADLQSAAIEYKDL